jgi:hypothetical protein
VKLGELLRHLAELRVGFGFEDGGLHIVTDFDLSAEFGREIQRWGHAIVALLERCEGGPWALAGELLELATALDDSAALPACYLFDQAADRAQGAVPRERATSTRIGSRRKRSGLGRARSCGDRTSSPRGRGGL